MPSQVKNNNNHLNYYPQDTRSMTAEIRAKMSVSCVSAGCNGNTDRSEEYSGNTMPGYPPGAGDEGVGGEPSLKLTVGIKTGRKTSWILYLATKENHPDVHKSLNTVIF